MLSLLSILLPIAIAPREPATEFVPIAIVLLTLAVFGFAFPPIAILPFPVILVNESSPIPILCSPVVTASKVVPKPML